MTTCTRICSRPERDGSRRQAFTGALYMAKLCLAAPYIAAACFTLAASGCHGEPSSDIVLGVSDLPDTHGLERGIWQSNAIDDTWVEFPARSSITLPHTLGVMPRVVSVYVSFDEGGQDSAPAAGDLARIAEVTDTTVLIRNGTDQDLYLRVALQ